MAQAMGPTEGFVLLSVSSLACVLVADHGRLLSGCFASTNSIPLNVKLHVMHTLADLQNLTKHTASYRTRKLPKTTNPKYVIPSNYPKLQKYVNATITLDKIFGT